MSKALKGMSLLYNVDDDLSGTTVAEDIVSEEANISGGVPAFWPSFRFEYSKEAANRERFRY